jgi:hypothetical protein
MGALIMVILFFDPMGIGFEASVTKMSNFR